MSNVDPGAENRGGPSYQRQNLDDLDDVVSVGDVHLSRLSFNGATQKWVGSNDETNGSVPTIAVVTAGAGSGSTAVAATHYNCTDSSGAITITGAGTPAAGAICTVTFGLALPANVYPKVTITLLSDPGAVVFYVTGIDNTKFQIATHTAIATSAYTVAYKVEP